MTVSNFSQAKDTFEGVPFTVLGLGDTNYDKYCYMGKSIDKRLCELGGKRCLALSCADEGTGLEETIEAWKRAVLTTVQKIHAESLAASATEAVDEEKIGEEGRKSEEEQTSSKLGSCSTSRALTPMNECHSNKEQFQSIMPENILSVQQLGTVYDISEKLGTPPAPAQLPKAKACPESKSPYQIVAVDSKDLLAGVNPSSESKHSTASPTNRDTHDGASWTAEHPFHAAAVAAKWLTSTPPGEKASWGQDRRVIHLELSLAGSQICYSPGDSIGICCPNAPYAVDIVLRRLQEAHPDSLINADTLVSCAADGAFVSLHEVLSYKYDLMGQPKKASMVLLAQCCTDPQEAVLLQHLCSKGETGKVLWEQFIEKQRMGVAEVLALFPSCTPKLHQLLACLTCLPPRYYSISSSPLTSQNRVTVAFSVVRYTCKADSRPERIAPVDIKRSGLCTTYLESLLRPLLCAKQSTLQFQETDLKIRVFHKVSLNFHLPGSVAPPLILIGPGTGVAPFMGFLEHRTQLAVERRRSSSEDCCTGMWRGGFELEESDLPAEGSCVQQFIDAVEPGPVYLFFGCRNEHDYLYRSELQEHLCTRVLTELEVAMSRVGPEKVYVTHKLRDRASEIARLVLEDQAHIYICGDGNSMAKDVYCTIKAILSKHAGLTDEETETMLQDMKLRRRYVLDIWS